MNCDLNKIKTEIEDKLKTEKISGRILLDRFKVLNESSRNTIAYNDSKYAPFYYYLGTMINPKNIAEIGFRFGLLSGCFLMGCNNVENFAAFQQKTDYYYSPRTGKDNIKKYFKKKFDVYVGKILDEEWDKIYNSVGRDLVFINEKTTYDLHMAYLDFLWPNINDDGLILVEYLNSHEETKESYYNFCKIVNRIPFIIETRYGIGVIKK